MALDEWLMLTAAQRPPTLRVYGWRRPTVSLGRNERWRGVVDPALASRHGVRVVRRPTGGRAVLHHREFTYSVTASPTAHPELGACLNETLAKVSEALADGLTELSIEARVAQREQALPRHPGVCFESSARYEILAGGQKVVGNAQYRTPTGFLQHGSMPLYSTVSSLRSLAGRSGVDEEVGHTGLLGLRNESLDRIGATMARAFASRFGTGMARRSLAEVDTLAVRRLAAARYARPDWTFRR